MLGLEGKWVRRWFRCQAKDDSSMIRVALVVKHYTWTWSRVKTKSRSKVSTRWPRTFHTRPVVGVWRPPSWPDGIRLLSNRAEVSICFISQTPHLHPHCMPHSHLWIAGINERSWESGVELLETHIRAAVIFNRRNVGSSKLKSMK